MQYQQALQAFLGGCIRHLTHRPRATPVSFLIGLSLLFSQGLTGVIELGAQDVIENEEGARWSFVILTGFTGPGPADDIGDALIQAGYDDTSRGGFFSSPDELHDHPDTPSSGTGFEFEIGYRLSPKMTLAISAGRTEFGSTSGFKETPEPNDFDSYWRLYASARHVSPSVVYRLGGIRTSLGPSLVQVRTWTESGKKDVQDAVRLGATAGVAFSKKVWRALNLELRARYRLVGSEDIGPFELPDGILPEFQASFNHWQIGFGFGVHLGKQAF